MKNIMLTFLLLSVLTITSNAQLQLVETENTEKSFRYVHKVQPLQLFQSNIKYAFEFAQSDRVSLEMEGGLRSRQVVNSSGNLYGQLRCKIYTKNSSRKLTGRYFAPVISTGSANSISNGFSDSNSILRPHIFPRKYDFLNVGLDYGYQQMVGRFVYDVFGGIGFSSAADDRGVEYNNTHLSVFQVALRLGFRVGIAHS